jgi:SAM-dependent methyltransferase
VPVDRTRFRSDRLDVDHFDRRFSPENLAFWVPLLEAALQLGPGLLSLVLHQFADPERAVGEAFRVLRPGGRVVVRTIAPEDAAERVPGRFVPAMAVADAARMPPVGAVAGWLDAAGFVAVERTRRLRSAPLELADEERSLRADAARYDAVGEAELAEGLQRLRAAAAAAGDGWIDPRPTWFVTATRAS